MRKKIDPRQAGLHHSTDLRQTTENSFVIVISRKSRIVMKDGNVILQKVAKIKATFPGARVEVETTAPVCGKTKVFLADHQVVLKQI